MKHYDSLIVGHICRDKNTDHLGRTVYAAGGAVLFSSAAANALGHSGGVVTRILKKDADLLEQFPVPREDIYCAFGQNTTLMENTYFTADKEKRRCVCAAQAEPLSPADIPADATAEIYHLAGLVNGDFTPDMISFLAKKGKVAVDVQGWVRNVDRANGGTMFFKDWTDKTELLPSITHLKTDAAEAEILTGTADRAKAADILAGLGAKEIVITHNTEVLVWADGKIYTCPIRARTLAGRTGRGDTAFAAYLCERLTHAPAVIMDADELRVLDSGILTAEELLYMYEVEEKCGNRTMMRIIGKHAAELAKKYDGAANTAEDHIRAAKLQAVALDAKKDRAGEVLEEFDNLVETFSRTVSNTAMIPQWANLTQPFIDMF